MEINQNLGIHRRNLNELGRHCSIVANLNADNIVVSYMERDYVSSTNNDVGDVICFKLFVDHAVTLVDRNNNFGACAVILK